MANSMILPCFCLHELAQTSATNMTGSPCRSHECKLILGADTKSNPWPLSIAVVCTVLLPAIFLCDKTLAAPLIVTPNSDKCNRRQTRKGTRARLHATRVILMQNKYYSIYKKLGWSTSTNCAMVEKGGSRQEWKWWEAFYLLSHLFLNSM